MGFRGLDLRAVLNSVSMPVLYWSVAVVAVPAFGHLGRGHGWDGCDCVCGSCGSVCRALSEATDWKVV